MAGSKPKKGSFDRLARFISDIANPLFLPPLVFFYLGWQMIESVQFFSVSIAIALVFYTVIPLSIVFTLLKKGHISSLDAPERKTRNKLFSYSIGCSAIGSLILFYMFMNLSQFLSALAIIYLVNPIIGLLINLKWKISIHSASLAMSATIISYFFVMQASYSTTLAICLSLVMLLLLLPMIWARYRLNVHTLPELLSGACIGVLLTLLELGLIL